MSIPERSSRKSRAAAEKKYFCSYGGCSWKGGVHPRVLQLHIKRAHTPKYSIKRKASCKFITTDLSQGFCVAVILAVS